MKILPGDYVMVICLVSAGPLEAVQCRAQETLAVRLLAACA